MECPARASGCQILAPDGAETEQLGAEASPGGVLLGGRVV